VPGGGEGNLEYSTSSNERSETNYNREDNMYNVQQKSTRCKRILHVTINGIWLLK